MKNFKIICIIVEGLSDSIYLTKIFTKVLEKLNLKYEIKIKTEIAKGKGNLIKKYKKLSKIYKNTKFIIAFDIDNQELSAIDQSKNTLLLKEIYNEKIDYIFFNKNIEDVFFNLNTKIDNKKKVQIAEKFDIEKIFFNSKNLKVDSIKCKGSNIFNIINNIFNYNF